MAIVDADFQQVVFEEGREQEAFRAEVDTKLTGWFRLKEEDLRFQNFLHVMIIMWVDTSLLPALLCHVTKKQCLTFYLEGLKI